VITAHELFGALHSGRSDKRLLMVLRAYLDASKTHPLGVTCVGGHVGTEEAWTKLEADWNAALAYWELDRFHLTDLNGIMGYEKATLCVRNFAHIIGKSDVSGISAGVLDADWDQYINQPELAEYRAAFPTRLHAVLDMALGRLSMEIGLNLPDEPTLVILDSDYNPENAARDVYDYWAAQNPKFCGLTITHSVKARPLEVADLYAGITRRDWAENGLDLESRQQLGPITWDQRARWNAGGRRGMSTMWSFAIAKKIEAIKARSATSSSEKASEGE
jgi:hypothetical protein